MLIGFCVLKHITWNTLVPQVQTELSWEQGTGNLICSQFFWPTDKAGHRLPLGCHRLVETDANFLQGVIIPYIT